MATTKVQAFTEANGAKLVAVLNEMMGTVRETDFDLFLHYSNQDDGWRVRLGSTTSDDWRNAGPPAPLVDALRTVLKTLTAARARAARHRVARRPRR